MDIGITEGKGIVYIHPARISQPLNFLPGSVYASGCDEKGNTTDALLKEVPAWQPGSWYETCKGKPNQKELEAMLGRPYHFVKPRKGQFTMDNSVEEMKDASSAGAPLRSMQISGGMKGRPRPRPPGIRQRSFSSRNLENDHRLMLNPHSVIKYRTYTAVSQRKRFIMIYSPPSRIINTDLPIS